MQTCKSASARDATYSAFVVILDVAICLPVHDVEIVHGPFQMLTSGNRV